MGTPFRGFLGLRLTATGAAAVLCTFIAVLGAIALWGRTDLAYIAFGAMVVLGITWGGALIARIPFNPDINTHQQYEDQQRDEK